MVATSPPPPPQIWPKECAQIYSPVRVIGRGGFAEVWMAKRKGSSSDSDGDTHVAVKVVGKDVYSRREVAILSELSQTPHPNIVRLLNDFKGEEDGGHHIVVMSLHRGPTLKHIIEKGGALGLKIAQTVSRQLTDAVAYLHGHAVIHRDIQPANLIISGAKLDDELWWSDKFDIDGKVLAHTKKCHLTLIDFGFARALAPEDITESKKLNEEATAVTVGLAEETETSRGRTSRVTDDSVSRRKLRGLTPLGTRSYAAPEILTGIRKVSQSISSSFHRRQTRRKSESECISDYGMVADAYSIGTTISHMITGIPPNIDADEFLASKNHPLKKLARKMKKCFSDKDTKRAKQYRLRSDLPLDVNEVIRLLTHFDERRRCTVRYARSLTWIKGDEEDVVNGESTDTVNSFMNTGAPMVYLRCTEDV
mmetsp:Transcript_11194/g.16500  ORF Transcript_11194/g.16500 Transcript_11194/m.16500 type:complete len:423 (+) Transcript_11194:98-1366(+)